MASGGMVLVKYLLFFFNFLFWLSGLAVIIVGAIIKIKYSEYIQVSSSRISTAPVFLIIIGAIIFIVGFLGCCGAWKENYCMVTTFAVLLAIIFILEIAAGALAYAYRSKLESDVTKGLEKVLKNYGSDHGLKKAMDEVQTKLHCCGSDGPDSYKNKTAHSNIPKSCCKSNCTTYTSTIPRKDAYQKGCITALEDFLKGHLAIVGGVGIGIAFIQLVGILFACCLMRSIKKEYEVM